MHIPLTRALRYVLLGGTVLLPAAATAQHAHEHEVASLEVAVDGRTLLVELESPLDNMVGFEHAPRTDAQRAALARMEERLRASGRLFKLPAEAACALRRVAVEHPYRPPSAAGPTGRGGQGGGRAPEDAGKTGEVHAEVHATFEFDCARPERLDRMEVTLFDVFPGMKRLRAQTATPRGQKSATLTAGQRTLVF